MFDYKKIFTVVGIVLVVILAAAVIPAVKALLNVIVFLAVIGIVVSSVWWMSERWGWKKRFDKWWNSN